MNAFSFLASDFFHWLWRNSWQAAALVILILGAQTLLRHRLSPAVRCALWVLLIARLLWPVSLQSPVSIFNVLPAAQPIRVETTTPVQTAAIHESATTPVPLQNLNWKKILGAVWFVGAALLFSIIAINTFKLWRRIRRERPLTDSAILDLLEDCKASMRIHTPLTVIESRQIDAPSLHGFVRPRLLLPIGLTKNFSREELRHIFLHELAHLKRADIPLNWLATALLILHWFNPLIWLAVARMRIDRELACDALALSYSAADQNTLYGETIIRLVEQFSRPAWAPGAVGIIEDKNQIKRRIQMIAQSPNRKTWPLAAAVIFIVLGAITFTEAQTQKDSAPAATKEQGTPRIVKTSPAIGAKDVDPATKEITITFDHDMAGGFSWTGGGPEFPPGRSGEKPTWRDKRTCSLPVTLEAGKYYRVGINSTSHQNFRSADGIPVKPSAIYFTTKGAADDVQQKTAKPQIVKMVPENRAADVDPKTTELRVTFSVPMKNGFSWTGGGPSFPEAPAGKKPFWTDDQKTCVLPVELKPGSEYRIGLNSPSHKNFQSANGVPLDPVTYTFKTK
ncbi:MAG TPA: M56 family metallopeptidase [Verrucomicrobiae bacterium]